MIKNTLTGKQKRFLRSMGMTMDPVVMIGKEGVSPTVVQSAAEAIKNKYPEKVELRIAESVPFHEYVEMMNGADAILDQLYSYTPSMNPLEAMKHGIICIGGGEPENYEILHEADLRPIVNVQPNYESVYEELEKLLTSSETVVKLQQQSRQYVLKHHESQKVAQQYVQFYLKKQ